MEKIAILLLLILTAGTVKSQTADEEIDLIEALFGMEKRAAVKEFIILENSETDAFWKIYDAYEITRKVYGRQRVQLLNQFADRFDTMTDEESDAWMKAVMELRKNNEKLIESYYKKIRKSCSPTVAMKFYQLESYVLAGIRYQILESVPF